MNPQTDFTFKKLLDNHELLIPVLNDAFNLIDDNAIKRIDFTDPERLRSHATDKSTTYDLSCITEKGERIIVEMQRASQQHFYKRAIYNLAVDVTCQSKIGNWNWNFDPVYQLCVCSFKLFPKDKQLSQEVILRGQMLFNNKEPALGFLNPLRLTFVQIPVANPEKATSMAEKFAALLKDPEQLPETMKSEPTIAQALETLRISSLSKEDHYEYERSLKSARDEFSREETVKEAIAEKEKERAEKEKERAEKEKANEKLEKANEEIARLNKLLNK